jgi:hypothetical protein
MKCSRAARLMSANLDRRLTEAEKSRLRLHLASCAECRKLQAALGSASGLVSALERRAPSQEFDRVLGHKLSIARALEIERPLGRSLWRDAFVNWFAKPAMVAAVILSAAFGMARLTPVAEPPMFAEADVLIQAIDDEFEQHNAMESMMDDAAFTLYELTSEEDREGRL